MLIGEIVNRLVVEGHLYLAPQSYPGYRAIREFYATEPVMDLIFAKVPSGLAESATRYERKLIILLMAKGCGFDVIRTKELERGSLD